MGICFLGEATIREIVVGWWGFTKRQEEKAKAMNFRYSFPQSKINPISIIAINNNCYDI